LEAILVLALKVVALPDYQKLLASDDPKVAFLTSQLGTTEYLEPTRIWCSMLRQYLLLEQQGLLVPIYAPEGGIDSERSPKPPRIRGYTDQGSRRPPERWLPPPPPVEDREINRNPDELARLEEFILRKEEE
jgi:hypothetical protein